AIYRDVVRAGAPDAWRLRRLGIRFRVVQPECEAGPRRRCGTHPRSVIEKLCTGQLALRVSWSSPRPAVPPAQPPGPALDQLCNPRPDRYLSPVRKDGDQRPVLRTRLHTHPNIASPAMPA